MDRSPTSFLKTPSSSTHFVLASPPEFHRTADRFISPTPSTGRERSIDILPPMKLHPHEDKMSIAAATIPTPPSLLSPPDSPENLHITLQRPSPPCLPRTGDILMADEPLLPVDGGSISLETPLFNVKEKDEPFIHKALLAEARKSPSKVQPSAEEYNVFVSTAWRLCQSNPREWLRKEMSYTSMYRGTSGGIQKPSHGKRQLAASPRRALPAGSHRPQSTSRPARAPRATPKMAAHHHFENGMPTPSSYHGSPTPAPRQRLTAPTREDSNFEALPDLTPPLSSLPNNNRCLMTDWRGTPLPIENEPHFDKLHSAEAKLASTLRLTPAIYLSSKRRMFIGKVQRTQIGKEFRKTDAQKACKIDVNKASKLWTAFDKVGWLNKEFVQPHLHKEINIEQ